MAQATTIRQGVEAELETDLGIRIEPGIIDEIAQQDNVGCVWVEEYEERDEQVDERTITIGVRLFEKAPRLRREPTRPPDPTSLETLAEAAENALKDKQAAQLGAWFFRVRKVRFNLVVRMVELEITAWQTNVFTT